MIPSLTVSEKSVNGKEILSAFRALYFITIQIRENFMKRAWGFCIWSTIMSK